jgi:hypothetical protein
MTTTGTGVQGFQDIPDGASRHNAVSFQIWQILANVRTAQCVQIQSCTNTGGDVPAGFVDVMPVVQQTWGNGVGIPHGVVRNLPYLRLQAGANAVIMDPKPGDVGLAVFCDRDISLLKRALIAILPASWVGVLPGSGRQFDFSDGVYVAGLLGATVPTQSIAFTSTGIAITSPGTVSLTAPNVTIAASTEVQITTATLAISAGTQVTVTTPSFNVHGNIVADDNITAGGDVIANSGALGIVYLGQHVHGGVTTGGGSTGKGVG